MKKNMIMPIAQQDEMIYAKSYVLHPERSRRMIEYPKNNMLSRPVGTQHEVLRAILN